jgi:hypothetical protein
MKYNFLNHYVQTLHDHRLRLKEANKGRERKISDGVNKERKG